MRKKIVGFLSKYLTKRNLLSAGSFGLLLATQLVANLQSEEDVREMVQEELKRIEEARKGEV